MNLLLVTTPDGEPAIKPLTNALKHLGIPSRVSLQPCARNLDGPDLAIFSAPLDDPPVRAREHYRKLYNLGREDGSITGPGAQHYIELARLAFLAAWTDILRAGFPVLTRFELEHDDEAGLSRKLAAAGFPRPGGLACRIVDARRTAAA